MHKECIILKNKKVICIIIIILAIITGIFLIKYFNSYDDALLDVNEVVTDSKFESVVYNKTEDITNDDVLGILTIEKIGLNATVKEGSDNVTLRDYIGHLENTSLYDGNICVAAHNRGNKYSYFARINELEMVTL